MTVTISDIMERIRKYSPDAELEPVMSAYLMAARAHHGQTRKSGEPYLSHPLEVANILAGLEMDIDTIATALLHDALEDNPMTKAEMQREIGPVITELVDGVTKIGKLKYRSKEELQAENFRKMMLAMSRDIRVILVKLADRLHNMRTLDGHRLEKRRSISAETLEVFAPLANRLGITALKTELEDLCFKYLYPDEYEVIEGFLASTQVDRIAYTERVTKALKEHLSRNDIEADVSGRAKHSYSIFKKMRRRVLAVAEVPDLLAFRVLVSDVGQCYAALGVVHGTFPPIPDRIKDYIARPKPNGYQSLHTTVSGPEGKRVEIQIRTSEMHAVAERGVAAHWKYKEGHLALAPDDVHKIIRIREVFETANEAEDATDFMETVKVGFFSDEVFVFTPDGDIKRFPMGATPLDFAYSVHTDVGNHCVGARVNGRMVPLRHELLSGDSVEILTSPNQHPSRDWLTVARTSRAISKIRRYLRQEERERGVTMGREILEAELKRFGYSVSRVEGEPELQLVLQRRNYKNLDPLLVDIARGDLPLSELCRQILPEGVYLTRQEEAKKTALGSIFTRFSRRTVSPVLIAGEDGVLVSYARCCAPLPGEPIVGFITRGRGITVHQAECTQLSGMDPERRIPVQWDSEASDMHSGQIVITCANKPGLLAQITKVCEAAKVNIQRAEAQPLDSDTGVVTLQLSVRDVAELTRVMRNVRKISGVVSVERSH